MPSLITINVGVCVILNSEIEEIPSITSSPVLQLLSYSRHHSCSPDRFLGVPFSGGLRDGMRGQLVLLFCNQRNHLVLTAQNILLLLFQKSSRPRSQGCRNRCWHCSLQEKSPAETRATVSIITPSFYAYNCMRGET